MHNRWNRLVPQEKHTRFFCFLSYTEPDPKNRRTQNEVKELHKINHEQA